MQFTERKKEQKINSEGEKSIQAAKLKLKNTTIALSLSFFRTFKGVHPVWPEKIAKYP